MKKHELGFSLGVNTHPLLLMCGLGKTSLTGKELHSTAGNAATTGAHSTENSQSQATLICTKLY